MSLHIRLAQDSDREQILDLVTEVFGQETADRLRRDWDWQWRDDPRLGQPGYRGMVVEWDGKIIASLSTIPAGLYLDGTLQDDAAWFTDVLTHWGLVRKAIRATKKNGQTIDSVDLSIGVAGALIRHELSPRIQLGKYATDAMIVVHHKAGLIDQPRTGSWARMVSLKGLLGRYVGRVPGALIGIVADLFLPAIPKTQHVVTRLEGDFDHRFDRLFESALQTHRAITRRDADFLNWRYRKNSNQHYDVFLVSENDELRGYLVLGRFERHNQPRAHLLDILVKNDDPNVIRSLIAEALRHLKKAGVARFECYTGSAVVQGELERSGFRQRLQNGRPMYTLVRRLDVPELYITRGDGDGG